MSPASSNRKKRWRLALAAASANGAGAVAGFGTQALISDPVVSTMVGTFVGGTTAELLLQVVRADGRPSSDAGRLHEADSGHDREHATARRCERDGPHRPAERRTPAGYARCTRSRHSDSHRLAGRPAVTPRHLRHRHLLRGAQRFVRRVRRRDAALRHPGDRRGAS